MRWKKCFVTKSSRFISTEMGYRKFGFMRYAETLLEGHHPPTPLTHIFSLARDRGCDFLIEEEIDQTSLPENEYELKVLKDLQRPHQPLNRRTFRVSFYRMRGAAKKPMFTGACETNDTGDPSEENLTWFSEHADQIECIGYVWINLDRNKALPVAAYVAEALIEPPNFRRKQRSTENQTFIHCQKTYDFEIFGESFELTGSFFAQQEGSVWCCAHAAILSCLNQIYGTKGHDMTIKRMNEIVGIDHKSRIAGDGLEVFEIKNILESENVPVAVHHLQARGATREQLLHAAYSAIEIGLPAIICFRGHVGHAMAVVGHTFDPSLWNTKASAAYFLPDNLGYTSSFSWVDKLIVQDDNFGPYQTVLKSDLLESVFAVVHPCHPKLLLSSPLFLAEKLVATYLNKMLLENGRPTDLFRHLGEQGFFQDNYWLAKLADTMANRAQVLRQTTINANTYYEQLRELGFDVERDGEASESDDVVIVEISIPELYQWNHRRLGEALVEIQVLPVVQDDGAERNEEKLVVRLIRLPGVMIVLENSSLKLYKVEADNGKYHREIVMDPR